MESAGRGGWRGAGAGWRAHAAWALVVGAALAAPLGARQQGERPPLVVDGVAVGWERLRGALAEAAGRAPIEELVLDLALERELSRRGLTVDGVAVERERERLSASIRRSLPQTGADESALASAVMRSRGLGPERLPAFLRRNAGLRALAGRFEARDDEVDLAVRVRTGPAVRARLIVTRSDREAASVRRELSGAGGAVDPLAFGALAAARSTHASGDRGGLIPRLSPDDPTLPGALRDAARTLAPGALSEVLAIDSGYAVLLVEESLKALQPPSPAEVEEIRAEIAEGKQRAAMEALAERLLTESRVTVFDASLRWSWERAGGR